MKIDVAEKKIVTMFFSLALVGAVAAMAYAQDKAPVAGVAPGAVPAAAPAINRPTASTLSCVRGCAADKRPAVSTAIRSQIVNSSSSSSEITSSAAPASRSPMRA